MGILTEDLAIPEDPNDLEAIYRGLCRLPKGDSKRRRIDFLTVPWQSKGAALLYYTVGRYHPTLLVIENFSFRVMTLFVSPNLIVEGSDHFSV